VTRAFDGKLGPRLAEATHAAHRIDVRQCAAEDVLRDDGEIVWCPVARLREVRRAHAVAGDAGDLDPAATKRDDGRLDVMADLGNRRIGEPARQRGRSSARDVDGATIAGRQRNTRELAVDRRRILVEDLDRDRARAELRDRDLDIAVGLAHDELGEAAAVRCQILDEAELAKRLVDLRGGRRLICELVER